MCLGFIFLLTITLNIMNLQRYKTDVHFYILDYELNTDVLGLLIWFSHCTTNDYFWYLR